MFSKQESRFIFSLVKFFTGDILKILIKQEAQLSPSDRAMRRVS